MWNIRMRASRKRALSQKTRGRRMAPFALRPSPLVDDLKDEHISGAEGIYPKEQINKIIRQYINRARNHPRGKPDAIQITVERVRQEPLQAAALPVVTLKCMSPAQAGSCIRSLLAAAGISEKAVTSALAIVRNKAVMRGAALIRARSGKRVEPDKDRGIRVSCLGIAADAEKRLSQTLARFDMNTLTVREALVLASKVAAHPDIVAELCVSDDPHYTTGYVASASLGYIRILHIKKKESAAGGRVFFLKETADVRPVIGYLEQTPVLVTVVQPCRGEASLHEILNYHQ
ncbi:MAG TPA: 6-carboxyhexanoate--CoA ligase [Thermodesulfovibrionales bacterium]|nr:6-carboxyhexanoate--CoA ligase [Thermodesulfovibrionales bacterium]